MQDRSLRQRVPPSIAQVDGMHTYWSKGIVNNEISLFIKAGLATGCFKIEDLQEYAAQWSCNTDDDYILKNAFSAKLLKRDGP